MSSQKCPIEVSFGFHDAYIVDTQWLNKIIPPNIPHYKSISLWHSTLIYLKRMESYSSKGW